MPTFLGPESVDSCLRRKDGLRLEDIMDVSQAAANWKAVKTASWTAGNPLTCQPLHLPLPPLGTPDPLRRLVRRRTRR